MNPCAVSWCCAMAVDGEYCAVHAKYPDLHPQALECDEEAVGVGVKCDDCDGDGTCTECEGEGTVECFHCGSDEAICELCEGTGDCPACKGTGSPQVKKRVGA